MFNVNTVKNLVKIWQKGHFILNLDVKVFNDK